MVEDGSQQFGSYRGLDGIAMHDEFPLALFLPLVRDMV